MGFIEKLIDFSYTEIIVYGFLFMIASALLLTILGGIFDSISKHTYIRKISEDEKDGERYCYRLVIKNKNYLVVRPKYINK